MRIHIEEAKQETADLIVKGNLVATINKDYALTLAAKLVKWADPNLFGTLTDGHITSVNLSAKFFKRYMEVL